VPKLPISDDPLLVRTEFSDDSAWKKLIDAVQEPSEEGFLAQFELVNDIAFEGLTVDQLLTLATKDNGHCFICIADCDTFTTPELPVLVMDLYEEPGRTFRVIPKEIWSVENNLSIANMDFCEFADNCDSDGIYRGFV